MLRWSVLLLSFVLDLPVLWQGLVKQQIPVEQVIFRFLVTTLVIAVLLTMVRAAFSSAAEQRADPSEDGTAK